ncbi:MAG TPA: hypothetical protein VKT32_10660 [Chthonomonadaceae bacterium]|nr:hypothetical protein [Chthonomonadaceae bacterium]
MSPLTPQPGKSTAIGACIESVWGQPPLTVQSGSNYLIGIPYSNPHRFMIVEPGNGIRGKATVTNPANEIDGTIETTRTILEDKTYRGTFDFKADPENAYVPIFCMFGSEAGATTMSSQSNTTGVYQHAFTPYKGAPSCTIEEIFGTSVYGRVTSGCLTESLSFTFGKNAVMAKWSLYGMHQVPNTYFQGTSNSLVDQDYKYDNTGTNDMAHSVPGNATYPCMQSDGTTRYWKCTPTPVYVDVAQTPSSQTPYGPAGNGPGVFGGIVYSGTEGGSVQSGFSSAFVSIDGVGQSSIGIVPGFNIDFARALDVQMIAGGQFDIGACVSKAFTCKGKMQFIYQDQSLPLAAFRHSTFSICFRVLGPQVGTTGYFYWMEFYLPNVKFDDPGPNVPDGMIYTGGTFVARQDPTLGYTAKVTLQNTVIAGQIAGGSGGIGGGRTTNVMPQ